MLSLTPGCSKAGFAIAVLAFALTGCGGGGSGSSSSSGVPIGDSAAPQAQVSTATDSVTLSWLAPTSRVNDEPISYQSHIAGYVVRYGRDSDALENAVAVECHSVQCEQIVAELGEGTWFFAVQTRDTNGLLSVLSEVVQKTI